MKVLIDSEAKMFAELKALAEKFEIEIISTDGLPITHGLPMSEEAMQAIRSPETFVINLPSDPIPLKLTLVKNREVSNRLNAVVELGYPMVGKELL